MTALRWMAWIAVLLAGLLPATASGQTRWGRDYFPNVVLQDHNGRQVRFYDDIVRGKVVSINFIFTSCTDLCPLDTARLREVQQLLGERVGRDVHMYTISINPERDTPEALRRFMRAYDIGPGWTFLTGSRADVDLLQRRLGFRPADQRNLRDHDASVIVGNEGTGQWIRRSAYESPRLLADLLGRALQNYAPDAVGPRETYAAAGEVIDRSHGAYLFRTRCRTCHTIGEGDRLGPDLAGVATARPRDWLSRWIREPDRMIAERDPTALGLMARYRNVPMPNLGLNEAEAEQIIEYLRREDTRRAE
jgi:cytochrome oxidase Cu insertion factor (SCO1/SenC/PrrC family)